MVKEHEVRFEYEKQSQVYVTHVQYLFFFFFLVYLYWIVYNIMVQSSGELPLQKN